MARSICKSLIENNEFNAKDLVSKFLQEFLKENNRGYGGGMFQTFGEWQRNGASGDPFAPAREAFGGSGSYGNGAAMRVAPVALFAQSEEDLIKVNGKVMFPLQFIKPYTIFIFTISV